MAAKHLGVGCILVSLLTAISVVAVDTPDEVPFEEGKGPPPANVGEGWCLVTIPATYKTVTRQQEVQTSTHFFETVPAKYETRTEQVQVAPEKTCSTVVPASYKTEMVTVMVKPEHKVLEIVPAQFEWADEQVEVRAASETISTCDATYKTVTEQIMVSPASTYWKREGPGECYCLCEKPAKYVTVCKEVLDKEATQNKAPVACTMKTVRVQRLVKAASVVEKTVPAEFVTVEKQIVDVPAKVTTRAVPARFETIAKEVEVAAAATRRIEIPAKFETITETVLDMPAHLVWRKHKCDCATIVAKYREVPGTDEASLLKAIKE